MGKKMTREEFIEAMDIKQREDGSFYIAGTVEGDVVTVDGNVSRAWGNVGTVHGDVSRVRGNVGKDSSDV